MRSRFCLECRPLSSCIEADRKQSPLGSKKSRTQVRAFNSSLPSIPIPGTRHLLPTSELLVDQATESIARAALSPSPLAPALFARLRQTSICGLSRVSRVGFWERSRGSCWTAAGGMRKSLIQNSANLLICSRMATLSRQIAPVPSAAQFLDVVLSSTQRKTPTVIHNGFKITRCVVHFAAALACDERRSANRFALRLALFSRPSVFGPSTCARSSSPSRLSRSVLTRS